MDGSTSDCRTGRRPPSSKPCPPTGSRGMAPCDCKPSIQEKSQAEVQYPPWPDAILCESVFAKNAMLTVAGAAPFPAVLGRTSPILSESEPNSSILHDDGGLDCITVRGVSRTREQALQAIIRETARQRLRRAAEANTRRTTESLAVVMGDLIGFQRPPTLKYDAGWRGPARA